MEATEPTTRPRSWFKRYADVRIISIARAGMICVTVSILLFVMLMLSENFFSGYEITSILFLIGAVSGIAAFRISYMAEVQERLGIGGPTRIMTGRNIAFALLGFAYLALVAALLSFWT
jgi:hypothetical protein